MNNMIKIDRFNVIDRVASSMESTTDDISKHIVYHYYDEDTNIQVRMHVDEWDNISKSEIINEIAMRYITTLRTRYIVERKWAKKERLRNRQGYEKIKELAGEGEEHNE